MSDIKEYRKMYLFMYRELINHTIFFQMAHKNYKKLLRKARLFRKSKIPLEDYELARAKYNFYFIKFNNIIGDRSSSSISYRNLTSKGFKKRYFLKLEDKPQKIEELINQFNKKREWSSHFSIADGRAKTERASFLNGDEISIYLPKHADIALAIDLFNDNESILNDIRIIKDYIEQDYYTMFNSKIEVKGYTYDKVGLEALESSVISYEYSQSKKHSSW